MKRSFVLTAAMLTLAMSIAACGNDTTSTPETPASSEVVIKAVNYKFEENEYRVKAGEPVKIVLESVGNHGLKIDELGLDLTPSKKSQVITPEAGEYEFECTIMCGPGHRDMVAKLIVE